MRSVISFLSCLAATAALAAPDTIPYRGSLHRDGIAVNGTATLKFQLFTDGDPVLAPIPIWEEQHDSVTVTQGWFEVQLGAITPLSNTDLRPGAFLGVVVVEAGPTDVPLGGRQELASVPYAFGAAPGRDFDIDGDISRRVYYNTYSNVNATTPRTIQDRDGNPNGTNFAAILTCMVTSTNAAGMSMWFVKRWPNGTSTTIIKLAGNSTSNTPEVFAAGSGLIRMRLYSHMTLYQVICMQQEIL